MTDEKKEELKKRILEIQKELMDLSQDDLNQVVGGYIGKMPDFGTTIVQSTQVISVDFDAYNPTTTLYTSVAPQPSVNAVFHIPDDGNK